MLTANNQMGNPPCFDTFLHFVHGTTMIPMGGKLVVELRSVWVNEMG
jgi:hypothetical protein